MDLTINDISFRAKLGKNILKKINKEFNYNQARIDKYTQLVENTFGSDIDKETVIDINNKNYFVFSNNIFPDVKIQYFSKMRTNNNVAKTLINECSKIFGGGEYNLFELIIIKYVNKGANITELRQLAQNTFTNKKSKEYFLENLNVAERIKKEQPKLKLNKSAFDYMKIIIMQEEAKTPGTKLNDLINKLDKLKLTFDFK